MLSGFISCSFSLFSKETMLYFSNSIISDSSVSPNKFSIYDNSTIKNNYHHGNTLNKGSVCIYFKIFHPLDFTVSFWTLWPRECASFCLLSPFHKPLCGSLPFSPSFLLPAVCLVRLILYKCFFILCHTVIFNARVSLFLSPLPAPPALRIAKLTLV